MVVLSRGQNVSRVHPEVNGQRSTRESSSGELGDKIGNSRESYVSPLWVRVGKVARSRGDSTSRPLGAMRVEYS